MTDQQVGRRLGAYEVRGLLGRGGMGAVYRGYDPSLQREVALKVVSEGGMLPDARERFRREARLAAGLRHPNIVQVHGLVEADGTLFMVQELLSGPSLADQLRRMGRRRLAPATVVRIVSQLAAALDYAHGSGVIHRDVKPGNALYNNGELVLTDFGLARATDVGATTTGPGVVMGTPAYVAPEQAVSSRGVSPACDIYSLGVVLFELLTGRLPFEADTPMGVILKHLYDEPPAPTGLRPELPKAIDAVLLRALRKEPEQRFPSAGALAQALAQAWPEARSARPAADNGRTPEPAGALAAAAGPRRRATTGVKKAARPAEAPPATSRETPGPASGRRAATGATPRPTPRDAPAARRPARETPRPAPTPAPAAPPQTAQASARPRRSPRLRVGLITTCAVGALLLAGFGVDPAAIQRGWEALMRLAGL